MTAIQKAREALESAKFAFETYAKSLRVPFATRYEVAAELDGNATVIGIALAALDAETPATPADVSEEPVAFVLRSVVDKFDVDAGEIVDVLFYPRGTLRPDNQEPLYSATALERVTRERNDARWEREVNFADAKQLRDTIERVVRERDEARADLEFLFSLDGEYGSVRDGMNIANACRKRATSAEAKLAEARKVIEPFAKAADRLRTDAPDESFADSAVALVCASHLRAARRWIEETK